MTTSYSLALACNKLTTTSISPNPHKQSKTNFPFQCNPLPTHQTLIKKPTLLSSFRVSDSRSSSDGAAAVISTIAKPQTDTTDVAEEVAKQIKEGRELRKVQWDMALRTLEKQIDSIRNKIETHFMDRPEIAKPMLTVLEDVKGLVAIHQSNLDKKNPVPTTDAMLNVAKHLQVFKESIHPSGLLEVHTKPKKTAFSPMIDMFVEVANLLYGQRGPQAFLQGNFAPVRHETPPTEVKVIEGQIPDCIRGMFVRNGPNPQFDPVAKYQWLDGDGMLHALRFKDGKTTYAARYTKTSRYLQEHITGQAEFPKYGDFSGGFGVFIGFAQLLKSIFVLDMSYGMGTANENLAYHDGMLLALEDFDRPYAIKIHEDGDLETLGIYDFSKKLKHNFTPHTKKDRKTGELFTFGSAYTPPYMTYRVISPDGSISDPLPIDVSGPTYMHDFAITENYVIIMDLPYAFDPETMIKNDDWIYNFDTSKKGRFGIRHRDPKNKSEIKWFEFSKPFFIFHNANAWEEGDKVVLYGCRMGPQTTGADNKPKLQSVLLCRAIVGEPVELDLPELYKFTFDLKTGKATEERVSTTKIDYSKVNENYMTRKTQYVYASEFNAAGKVCSIVKYDLQAGQEKKMVFGGNIFGSEVAFVPSDNPTKEDDGYLITFVHDEDTSKSYGYVICAQKMEKVAVLELPSRVPYGFHAIFITEEELKRQKKLP